MTTVFERCKTTPTTETTFVYDSWNLIHEAVAIISGATTNITEIQYFWGTDISETLQGAGNAPVVENDQVGRMSKANEPRSGRKSPRVGGLLAVSLNGLFYFPAYDNNGNITKYIDESGTIVAAYEYNAFGKTISQSGSLADTFRHRFSTKYFETETGLYYYGYRFYSPTLMRWLCRDPIEEDGGLNLYAFCGNGIFKYDALGLYINMVYEVEKKTLTATDVDTSETLTLKEKVFSGNGESCCVKADQWKSAIGPLPAGKYLVGLSYVPKLHLNDTGDYNWYRLYGDNGKGGYTYNDIPVKAPDGTRVYRGGFNLHTGRASNGCVTVWSDIKQGEKGYPQSDDYDKLKKLLDKTKPLKYKNSEYTGWLEVK